MTNNSNQALTPAVAGLQKLALRQLATVTRTLERLQDVAVGKADQDAVTNTADSVKSAVRLLRRLSVMRAEID